MANGLPIFLMEKNGNASNDEVGNFLETLRNVSREADANKSVLMEPYFYLACNHGKDLRKQLITAFDEWLHVPSNKVFLVSEIIDMLHNASLVIDDIEDHSFLRRGKPCAHHVYGVPSSLNSANYVYFLALEKINQLGSFDATRIFAEQMLELHRGQGMDIFWRCSYRCPTESEYCGMVINKTGGLFKLAVRLLQLFSDNKVNYVPLVDMLALFFQIRDDYANLVDTSYHRSKSYAEDISEGKFSFPIVRAIHSHPDDHLVTSTLFQRPSEAVLKLNCVRHMARLGALDYTVSVLVALERQCLLLIESHGGNAQLSNFVAQLSEMYRRPEGGIREHKPEDFETDLLPKTTLPLPPSQSQNPFSSAELQQLPNPALITKLLINNHFANSSSTSS